MQPTANGLGDIGDGVTLAIVGGGVVDAIGSVRQYNAVNPFDIGVESIPAQPPALPPCVNADAIVASMPNAQYPMTFHQRLNQWPDTGIGEVRLAGSPSVGKSYPPKEMPIKQSNWSTCPITVVPIFRVDDEIAPFMGEQPLDSETSLPVRCIPFIEFRTLYKTSPWTPTVFVKNNPYGGDTRKWYLSGVTKDGTDTPIISCRVIAMQTEKVVFNIDGNANPIVADIVSSAADGSYLIQVNNNRPFWLIGYKDDSPDKAGSTIDLVIPVDG